MSIFVYGDKDISWVEWIGFLFVLNGFVNSLIYYYVRNVDVVEDVNQDEKAEQESDEIKDLEK